MKETSPLDSGWPTLLRWGWRLLALAPLALAAVGLAEPRTRMLLIRSWSLALSAAMLSGLLGGALSWLLFRSRFVGQAWLRAWVVSMVFIPPVLAASAWEAGWGRLGWYTLLGGNVAHPWLGGWRAAVWVHAMLGVPWVVLIVGPAWRSAAAWEEPARLENGPGPVFWRVSLPGVAPFLAAAMIWVAAQTFTDMTVTDIYAVRTFAEELYVGYALGESAAVLPRIIAPAMLSFAWLLAATCWMGALTALPRRNAALVEPSPAPWRRWSIAPAVLLTLLVCGAPLLNLVLKAGATRGSEVRDASWSAAQLLQVLTLTGRRYAEEFLWSLVVGVGAAAVALAIAAPLAWISRRAGWRALLAPLAAGLLLALPGPLIGLGLIRMFLCGPAWLAELYRHSIAAPVAAQALRALPLTALICWHGFRTLPQAPMEYAALEGMVGWRRWTGMILPLAAPYLAAAGLAALAVAIGELAATVLVAPPGLRLFATTLFGLIHFGVRDLEAGVALTAMLLQLLLAAACGRFLLQAQRMYGR